MRVEHGRLGPAARTGCVWRWRSGRTLLIAGVLVAAALLLWLSSGCSRSNATITETARTAPATRMAPTRATTTSTVLLATTTASAPSTPARPSSTTVLGPTAPGKEYTRLPGSAKVIALTFDAAYDPKPLKDILAALAAEGVPATFFFTGEFVEDFPDAVASVVAAGHPIGSHSYSHPDFTGLSDESIQKQLERTAALIRNAGAPDPWPLFRFPYGSRNKRTLAAVAEAGYVSVYWTIDTIDWKTERTSQQIKATVLTRAEPGAIVLMHVGSRQTAAVLVDIIRELKDRGYGFVNLRQAFG